MGSIHVTEATESHVPEIVEMWKEFMDFHSSIDPFFTREKEAHLRFETYLRELIKSDNAQVLVAIDELHVVAYSISQIQHYPPIYVDEQYGFISDLAVNPAYQRKKIGETMLMRIFEWVASCNIKRIELHVAARNHIGYSFWKKHGFQDYMHVLYTVRE